MPHEGQFLSCCAVVNGSARNLFVVPRPEVLAPHRESILAAVQEAAADPAAQGHLMRTLHVSPLNLSLCNTAECALTGCLGRG